MYDQNSAFNAAVGNNYLPSQYGYGMLPSNPFVAVAAAGRNDQLLTMMSGQSTINGIQTEDGNEKECDTDKNG
uniref:Uncharacterized protein n=1 Tax=Panagrolaimus davidi TaxID=227884 RepID=A0A914PMK3_9BILA